MSPISIPVFTSSGSSGEVCVASVMPFRSRRRLYCNASFYKLRCPFRERIPMRTPNNRLHGTIILIPILLSSLSSLWSQQPQPATQAPQQSAVPALPADIPSTAERYSFLMTGNPAGQQAVWAASDGTLHIFFQFNDRGRGPKTTSILKLDANGLPVSEVITGNDYLKSPVNENYSLEGGTARWKNDDEQGDKKTSAPAYYVPLNPGLAEYALLAHAAIQNGGKTNSGKIALLPEGEARVQRM